MSKPSPVLERKGIVGNEYKGVRIHFVGPEYIAPSNVRHSKLMTGYESFSIWLLSLDTEENEMNNMQAKAIPLGANKACKVYTFDTMHIRSWPTRQADIKKLLSLK